MENNEIYCNGATTLSDSHILVKDMKTSINSPIFFGKKASGYLSIYDIENDYELKEDDQEIEKKINYAFDHSPDGALVWIPVQYKESFEKFATKYLKKSFSQELLNFDNGGVAETLLFHDFPEGYMVEMLDPECFSEVFPDLLKKFTEENKLAIGNGDSLDSVAYANGSHLSSGWHDLDNFDGIKTFLKSKGF